MSSHPARRLLVVAPAAVLAVAGCGGHERRDPAPADQVRAAASGYLRALQGAEWTQACRLMTDSARRDLADAAGASCARALSRGAALPADQLATAGREVPGAPVRVDGTSAAIGPLGGLSRPLRLQRVDGRWLIAG
jgi:hypothetical protein